MCSLNEGFEDSAQVEMEMEMKGRARGPDAAGGDPNPYTYEEALNLSGEGAYTVSLVLTCFVVMVAMGVDIFGLGIIVAAAACELDITLAQVGVLSSMPFAGLDAARVSRGICRDGRGPYEVPSAACRECGAAIDTARHTLQECPAWVMQRRIMVPKIGIVVMSYPWGYLADSRGRRVVLVGAMGGGFLCAALSSLAPSWQLLAALRFLGSALSSAAESGTYALLGECCPARVRARYMLLITSALMLTPTLYYVTGYLIMKMDFSVQILGIVYRPWRLLTLVMALPLGVSALLLYFFSESPKFLANVGRTEEAVEVLSRMYRVNGNSDAEYPVKRIVLEEDSKEEVGEFSVRSLWKRVGPLFRPPLLGRTLLLYYLTFVAYIANNSFAIILPTIFNVFFTSYAADTADTASFCDLLRLTNATDPTDPTGPEAPACEESIMPNTVWAGCAHGLSFFILNALISQCASKRKVVSMAVLAAAAAAGIGIDNTGEPLSGLVLFLVFLTTAMLFGIISSYFVDLYPTSYRGMVACLGMLVARLSAFVGASVVGSAITLHCAASFYGAAVLLLSGAVAAWFLPPD